MERGIRLKLYVLFFSLLIFSCDTFAEEYYWQSSFYQSGKDFKSPSELCVYIVNKYGTFPAEKKFSSITRIPSGPEGSYYCNMKFKSGDTWSEPAPPYWSNINGYLTVHRRGAGCAVGKYYERLTGECLVRQPDIVSKQLGIPEEQVCGASVLKGNPINIALGNKIQKEVFYEDGSSGVSFFMIYNSSDGVWRHNYSARIKEFSDRVVVVMADGRERAFNIQGSAYISALDEKGSLARQGLGWVYRRGDNSSYFFNESGRLIRLGYPSGRVINISYDSPSELTVSGEYGAKMSILQFNNQRPYKVTVGSKVFDLLYGSAYQLKEVVTNYGGQISSQKYHYEDVRAQGLLTGITDKAGVRYATWSYDELGRAISSEHAGGVESVSVKYNDDGSVNVIGELGRQVVYNFQSIQGVRRITSIEGEPSANCPNSNSSFTYDDRGLLKTKTDSKGYLTSYEYNDRGLEVIRVEAVGTPQARSIATEWHPTLFLPVAITESDRIITYTYDAQGRKLSQSVTPR